MKVVGIGLQKTGTTTLGTCLKHLGYKHLSYDHKAVFSLRNGDYVKENNDYTYIFELVAKFEDRFNYAKKHTELPEKPDNGKIDDLVMEINSLILG